MGRTDGTHLHTYVCIVMHIHAYTYINIIFICRRRTGGSMRKEERGRKAIDGWLFFSSHFQANQTYLSKQLFIVFALPLFSEEERKKKRGCDQGQEGKEGLGIREGVNMVEERGESEGRVRGKRDEVCLVGAV